MTGASATLVSSGLCPPPPPAPPPPAVVPPHVLALDLGAYDIELEPDTIGDSVAVTAPPCVVVSSAAAAGGGGGGVLAPPFLAAAAGLEVLGASRAVVVASVRGLKLAAAAAAAVDDDDVAVCLSRAYDCHDLRRSRPAVVATASAQHNTAHRRLTQLHTQHVYT